MSTAIPWESTLLRPMREVKPLGALPRAARLERILGGGTLLPRLCYFCYRLEESEGSSFLDGLSENIIVTLSTGQETVELLHVLAHIVVQNNCIPLKKLLR